MIADLKYLISTFDAGTRGKLILYVIGQFVTALMDLLGLAAIYPLMQLALGAPIDGGTLGTIRGFFGDPARNDFAVILALIMVLAFLGKALLSGFFQWWSLGLVTKLQTRTAKRLLSTYLSEGYLEHRRRNTGEVIRTVGAANQAAHSSVLGGLLSALSSLLSVAFMAGLLLVVTPIPAIAATLYFVIIVFVIQRVLAPANRRAGEVAQHTAWRVSKSLMDSMHAFREANLHDARGFFIDSFDEANVENAGATQKANFLSQLPKIILEFVTMVGLIILIVISIVSGNAATMMPTLSLFVGATIKILPLMVALTATIGMIRVGRDGLGITVAAMKEMASMKAPVRTSVGRRGRPITDPSTQKPLPDDAAINIDHLTFRYDADADPVLRDINLSVPAGTSLALCGPSGSGKTTLVDIILGLIPPTEGEVTYGGVKTMDRDPRWLDAVAYVPQDVFLLDDSLAENVAFGIPKDQHDEAKIMACLERAQLTEVIENLPDGIQTQVGERGTRLSGGQRQRVGIARALYRDPKVIIFDEATSALDNATEHKITQTVNSLRGEITTVIVAHRLSTVRDVDKLAFLQHGEIEALGTFEEVEAASPTFARLVELGRLDGHEGDGVNGDGGAQAPTGGHHGSHAFEG